MSEVMETVGGFRSAIQDLLVPELKAVQAEIRNVKETLDRHERWLERLDQNLTRSHKELTGKIEVLIDDHGQKFSSIMKSIGELEKNVAVVLSRLDFAERLSELEIQMARLTKPVKTKKGKMI
jgi:hypothetical protein